MKLDRAIDLLLRRLWIALGLLLATTGALGLGLPRLRFEFSPGAMLRIGASDDRFFRRLNRIFDSDSAQPMVVVRRRGGVLHREVLEYVDRLVAALRRESWVAHASGITTVRIPRSRGADLERRAQWSGRAPAPSNHRVRAVSEPVRICSARAPTPSFLSMSGTNLYRSGRNPSF